MPLQRAPLRIHWLAMSGGAWEKSVMAPKREVCWDDSDRPAKVIRVDTQCASNMATARARRKERSRIRALASRTRRASTAAAGRRRDVGQAPLDAFDCSALMEALAAEPWASARSPEGDPDFDVHVPGAVRSVPIPKQVFLTEIARWLHLNIRHSAVKDEGDNVIRGIIEMEVPCAGVGSGKEYKKFMSDDTSNQQDAMESAAASAIAFLCKERDVVVEDLNHFAIKQMGWRLQGAEYFADPLTHSIEKKSADFKRAHDGVKCFFHELKRVCKEFSDVIPISIGYSGPACPFSMNCMVSYAGSNPPATRIEKFAKKLVLLINTNADFSMVVAGARAPGRMTKLLGLVAVNEVRRSFGVHRTKP
ncbi:hypothetical protein ACP4OV_007092 [Aristida adscensionis]